MRHILYIISALLFVCISLPFPAQAAEQGTSSDEKPAKQGENPKDKAPKGKSGGRPKGPPPARVVTATARSGEVRPQYEYVGTVYFPEVSQVAAEVAGRVEKYTFEEGRGVTHKQKLIELDTELMKKDLETAKFEYRNVFSSLENARRELSRIKSLYKKKTVSEQDYDKAFYLVAGLESRATALQAKVSQLEIKLDKSSTRAPFDGMVLERLVSRGEWVTPGEPVAVVARNDAVDVLLHVPQDVLPFLQTGQKLPVQVGASKLTGEVYAVIPKGDVSTRTFPIKIRTTNDGSLAQGMEARVRVPVGEKRQAVLVPRDAVLLARGQNALWAVFGDKAVNIPVDVTAYMGMDVAVQSLNPETPLKPGMQVVIKGNERLRPGQRVVVVGGDKGAGAQNAPDKTPSDSQ